MTEETLDKFLERFDNSVHDTLRSKLAEDDTDALICFENQDMCSSELGRRTALVVGPTRTYKSVEDCKGRHLNDLPSQRQYPVAFVKSA